ncbi:sulfite exporter TauE/SafE family protein [Chthonobacter rhizosphaerae]|uniref:sulfite exporter TauE/SafE family protein n=1 Tax=Chthonobacter rhizosphaerae TaxID=2735553 RepID=UPI0015EE7EF1|nr:sulfite exporter TauE/SafE family protein [Chthonobacter rhizosphaerae]
MFADFLAVPLQGAMPVALAVVFVAGLVRGFSGFGAGLIYVPVASALFGPKTAAATILLFDIPAALPFVIRLLPKANVREVVPLAAGACLMTPVGAWALVAAPTETVRWAISLAVLGGVALIAAGVKVPTTAGPGTAVGVGAASGFLNGLAQIGGPPLILFWLGRAIPPETIRASAMLFFAIGTAATLATYLMAGLIDGAVWLKVLWMAPVFAAGMTLGGSLFGRTSERTYRLVAYGLIAGAGLAGLPVW